MDRPSKDYFIETKGHSVHDLDKEPPTLKDKLTEEGEKFITRFGGILYPKAVLAAYDRVLTGRWNVYSGNPELLIDELLKEFVDSIGNKNDYIVSLKEALTDDMIKNCLALRLTYAALLEKTVDEIAIHTIRRSTLLCQDQLINAIIESGGKVYTGKNPSEMDDDEISKKADEFYSNKEVISQSTTGFSLDKRQRLAQMISDLGFEFLDDKEVIYNELQNYRDDYETMLVARLAFLLLTKDDGQKLL